MARKFLLDHARALLAVLALIFLATIVGYFVWGIGYIVMEVNDANHNGTTAAVTPSFDLKGAATLDYRGVLQQ